MKKVFIYEIKKLLIPLAIYLGIMTIIGFTIMLTAYDVNWTSFSTLYGMFMLLLMFGLIYIVFSYNKKRINADMTYALPVTKTDLFVGKYLASLAVLLGMAIVYLLLCLIMFGLANMNLLFEYSRKVQTIESQLGSFVLGCLIHIAITIPLFNFLLLFYYKANTVLDGIIFNGLGLLIVYLLAQIMINLIEVSVSIFPLIVYVQAPYCFLETPFSYASIHGKGLEVFHMIFSIYIVLGTLLTFYLIWFSKRDCSIRTQGICDGIFGYKVFLPLVAALIPIIFCTTSKSWTSFEIIWFILTAVGLFIGYCIYHRSVKFNKASYIVFAATLGFDFIFLILSLAN